MTGKEYLNKTLDLSKCQAWSTVGFERSARIRGNVLPSLFIFRKLSENSRGSRAWIKTTPILPPEGYEDFDMSPESKKSCRDSQFER